MRAGARIIGAALALSVGAAAQAPSSSWPQFRNTPTLSGVASSPLPASLRLQWTYEAGSAVESSAAVVGGSVYVGTSAGELVALEAASGRLKWKYTSANPDYGIGESSPAVANGTVYIGDLDGVFHAVDAATGEGKWTFRTKAEIKSSPVVAGDRVLIGSYDGSLYALDATTGRELWKVTTDNYVHATPAIWNGVAYFAPLVGALLVELGAVTLEPAVRVLAWLLVASTALSALDRLRALPALRRAPAGHGEGREDRSRR